MNLNRRGYLAVEIILASVVAISIAIFLMEITIKLVNVTDDAYIDTEILTDKALIIKNIKEDLENNIYVDGGIESITCPNSYSCSIHFCDGHPEENRNIVLDGNRLIYQDDTQELSTIYEKNINKDLSNITITSSKVGTIDNGEYVLFRISADNKFSKENFEVNIIVNNNDKIC